MGETGVKQSDPNVRADHVHYQLKDPAGNKVNPTDYWDRQGSVDPNPAPPAYLGEYQQYSQIPNQALSPDRSNSFDNRFGNWPSAPVVSASDATMPPRRPPPSSITMFEF
jgi:hypothetical protein